MSDDTHATVLLVDDDDAIITTLNTFLELSGYKVIIARNGEDALQKVEEILPDIVVLDVLMPRMNGRDALRKLRKDGNWIPVILLTQLSGTAERIMALQEGADDYLNKPFDPQELVARIQTVLRRTHQTGIARQDVRCLQSKLITLDRLARRVKLDEEYVSLTPKAFAILEYMMTHPNELVTRDHLLTVVWGWENVVGERVVDTRIAELRKILNDNSNVPEYIETLPGQGYRYIAEVKEIFSC